MIRAAGLLLGLWAAPLAAQSVTLEPLLPDPLTREQLTLEPEPEAEAGLGAALRILDKQNGTATDVEIEIGAGVRVGLLTLRLGDCRYPADNPNGEAYAFVTVHYNDEVEPVFSGWMFASSPALNALDHPRYDVWPLRCRIS